MLPPSLQESVSVARSLDLLCRFRVLFIRWFCSPPVTDRQVEVLWKESVYSHGLSGSALVNPEERLKAEPVDTRDEDDGIEEVHLDDADFSDFSGSNVDSGDDFD